MDPVTYRIRLRARIFQIVAALDPTPAQNAVIESLALLTLSAYAGQAGSIPGDYGEIKRDWLADCETAWDMAQNLSVPASDWLEDLG